MSGLQRILQFILIVEVFIVKNTFAYDVKSCPIDTSRGTSLEFKIYSEFDIRKMTGKWFVIETTEESKVDCETLTFTSVDNDFDPLRFQFDGWTRNGNHFNSSKATKYTSFGWISGTHCKVEDLRKSIIYHKGGPCFHTPFHVLMFQPRSHAIFYNWYVDKLCFPVYNLWIVGRSKSFDSNVQKEILHFLNLHLTEEFQSKIRKVKHETSCRYKN